MAQVDLLITRAVVPVEIFAVSEGRLDCDLLLLISSRRLVNFGRTGHIASLRVRGSWARLKISLKIVSQGSNLGIVLPLGQLTGARLRRWLGRAANSLVVGRDRRRGPLIIAPLVVVTIQAIVTQVVLITTNRRILLLVLVL